MKNEDDVRILLQSRCIMHQQRHPKANRFELRRILQGFIDRILDLSEFQILSVDVDVDESHCISVTLYGIKYCWNCGITETTNDRDCRRCNHQLCLRPPNSVEEMERSLSCTTN